MSFPDYRSAVVSWLSGALPGYSVIAGHQNAPKPGLTFGVVSVLSLTPVGLPDYRGGIPDTKGDVTRDQLYEASVNVQFYGSNAEHCAREAHRSTGAQAVHDAFRSASVSLGRIEQLKNVDAVVDGRWEPRWTFDFFCSMIASDVERISWIEHVEITATVVGSRTTETEFEAP